MKYISPYSHRTLTRPVPRPCQAITQPCSLHKHMTDLDSLNTQARPGALPPGALPPGAGRASLLSPYACSESSETYIMPDFPPVRACIFDSDGLLINSEDIYSITMNEVLHEYDLPDIPWTVKATQQSRGRQVGGLSQTQIFSTPARINLTRPGFHQRHGMGQATDLRRRIHGKSQRQQGAIPPMRAPCRRPGPLPKPNAAHNAATLPRHRKLRGPEIFPPQD